MPSHGPAATPLLPPPSSLRGDSGIRWVGRCALAVLRAGLKIIKPALRFPRRGVQNDKSDRVVSPLRTRGVGFATLTLAAGMSSTGDAALGWPK